MECPVCMSAPVFGVQLKCEHILCYLCLKGVTNSNGLCPLCRKSIDGNVLKRPKFVIKEQNSDRPSTAFESMQWFYEGKRGTGYWAYDTYNGQLLEQAFNSDQKMCEIAISGVVYCVDFVQQIQYQKDNPFKKRNVRRDMLSNIQTPKGISGVSKRLIRDLFTGLDSQPIENDSNTSQQNGIKCKNNSLNSSVIEQNEESISKRIKVEVKEEADSTTE